MKDVGGSGNRAMVEESLKTLKAIRMIIESKELFMTSVEYALEKSLGKPE